MTYGLYGLAYFTLGIAVGARAIAQSPSSMRRRLLAFAAFGLLHGTYEWLDFALFAVDDSLVGRAVAASCALSFMPLAYFGLSRADRRQWPIVVGLAAWLAVWSVATLAAGEAALVELITRYGVAIPAALLAAHAFACDPTLQSARTRAPQVAAAIFVTYAGLEMFLTPGTHLPAALFTTTDFETVTGFPILVAKTSIALFATAAVLALLDDFDAAMHRQGRALVARASAALAASEARLQQVLEAEPECVKSLDAECRLLDMNPAGLAMIEAKSIDLVRGTSVLDLVAEPYRNAFRNGVAAVFRGERTRQRFEIVGRMGRRLWVEQTAAPLYDPEAPGRVREAIAVTRDITDQVTADRMVRETNARLQQAQRVARLGCWDWNIVTNALAWSDEIYRIFGLEPQQFGASYPAFLERVHPDDRAIVTEGVRRAVGDNEPYSIDHRIVRPDGTLRWVHEQGEIERAPDGTPLRMLGIVQDISELHLALSAMRESQASLAGILRISPEAVITTDDTGTITMFSAGAERIFGHSRGEALGQSIELLIPERYHAAHRRHFAHFVSAGESSMRMGERAEIVGRRKDGSEFAAEASLSRLDSGSGTALTTILRDITQSKAANDELVAARCRAEAASEAKSQFIANMSHELRTPLNAIIGFSYLLIDEPGEDPDSRRRREYAGHIHESGNRLLTLIDDVLDISRTELGEISVADERIDIANLLHAAALGVSQLARQRNVAIRQSPAPDLPGLSGDPRLLAQILQNLLSNAIKFSPRDGAVELTAHVATSGGLTIEVRDRGIGMAPAQLAHLGLPFQQGDASSTRKYGGLGLGVSIARRLTELHGGSLSFESAPGTGTCVRLLLPATRTLADRLATAAG